MKILLIIFVQALLQISKDKLYHYMNKKTIQRLHDDMASSIMSAPINLFFDVTAHGAIMQRFTKDLFQISHFLYLLDRCMEPMVEVVAILSLIMTQNRTTIIIVPFLMVYFLYL